MRQYRTVEIFFFSGTGNARNVALAIEQEAQVSGLAARVTDMATMDRIAAPTSKALIVFVSPVHGFNYPAIVLSFLLRFPRGRNAVALLNTRAGMKLGKWVTPGVSGVSLYLAALILKWKGYRIQALHPVDLPSNWMSLHPGLNAGTVDYLYDKAIPKARALARRLFDGQREFRCVKELVVDVLVSPVALLYFVIGRFVIAKTFYASKDCNRCGLCSQHCPVHAIQTRDGRPFWTFRCESCMRCMGNCPKRAIETAHGMCGLWAVGFGFAFTAIFNLAAANVSSLHHQAAYVLIKNSLLLLAIAIGYRLFHFLLRFAWFERLTVFTSLTKLPFWTRYKTSKRI
jgi:Pyruvate/2-oxoacid:ferredoxin oxidoreductase delta subunit